MIALDSSAIIAILANETRAEACKTALDASDSLVICAATVTETLIVASKLKLRHQAELFFDRVEIEVCDVTFDFARRAANAHTRWGKGIHPASLNYGDCFSYAVAELYDCPLLFIGDDFAQTDIVSALG